VGVQDPWPHPGEVPDEPQERDRVDVGRKRNRIERDAALGQRAREVLRARLVLMEHEQPHVPATLAQPRQE
jgi:hypothetical protein